MLGVQTGPRPAQRVDHRISLIPPPAAQAAAGLGVREAEGDERRQVIRSAVVCDVCFAGEVDAAIADEDTRSRDQFAHLCPGGAAERAGQVRVPARLGSPAGVGRVTRRGFTAAFPVETSTI